ncbi:MAG: DUF1465 family protein [Alphaproteobacteria bacterium]
MADGEPVARDTGGLADTSFFSKTYDEAYELLVDARNYVSETRSQHWDRPVLALVHSQETMRLTARVTHMLAWLLTQRAVHSGEISAEDATGPRYRLEGREVCLDVGAENAPTMPEALRALLARSRKLYQRVARLDDMMRRDRDARPFPFRPPLTLN